MKAIKYLLYTLLFIILAMVIGLYATGNEYILTGISRTYLKGNTTANIDDYKAFYTRVIETSDPQPWVKHPDYNPNLMTEEFVEELDEDDGIAFLVVKDGKLMYEKYLEDYNDRSKTNSFSMAKTMLTMMIEKAIEEGYISGWDAPLVDYLPEFKDDPKGNHATIKSLSTMTSGYNWDEQYYSPFSPTVELLYGDDVKSFLLERDFSHEPDTYHYYSSASSELLAIILDRALKKKNPEMTISQYFSEKFWKPLGMNDDALWHLDDNGMELAFCCVNTNARNFAKLGQLLLQDGKWKGTQLIDSAFVAKMHTPGMVNYYGLATWINPIEAPYNYSYRGHLGQHIIIVPEEEMVIVRLGTDRGKWKDKTDLEHEYYIDEVLEAINSHK